MENFGMINLVEGIKLEVDFIPGFPLNEEHLQIIGIPNILITKGGEKISWFRDFREQSTNKEFWCVRINKKQNEKELRKFKQFRSLSNALSYGVKLCCEVKKKKFDKNIMKNILIEQKDLLKQYE